MKIYQIIINVAVLSCMFACNSQNEDTFLDKRTELEVNLKGCDSRTIITGNALPDESQMGIYTIGKDSKIVKSNVLVKYVNGACQISEPIYLDEEEMEVYAYYPYDKSVSSKIIQVDVRNQIDYLYGFAVNDNDSKTVVNSERPRANILLKHVMSRITFNIQKAEEIETELYFTDMMLENFNGLGTFDIQKGEFESMEKIGNTFKFPKESKSVDFLAIPTDNVENIYLRLGINNKSYEVKLPEGTWKSGQQYTYTIVVEKGNVSIETIEITPWNDNMNDGIEINDNNYIEN